MGFRTTESGELRMTVEIDVPLVLPLGIPANTSALQDVWDVFVKPAQDAGESQSAEMRVLMAVLRSVYAGLEAIETTGEVADT